MFPPLPPEVPGRTWTEMVSDHAAADPLAVAGPEGGWRFSELHDRAAAWAVWLDDIGAEPGEVLPVILGASPTAYPLLVAGAHTDRPIAPLGDRMTPSELLACIEGMSARLLLVEPDFKGLADEVAVRSGVRVVVLPSEPPRGGGALPSSVPRDQVIYLLHTSGTTGSPKPVRFTNDRLGARSRAYGDVLGLGRDDVFSSSQQFHHLGGAGMLLVAMSVGATVVPPTARFSIEGWQDLARLGTTHATLAPTMIERLLAAGRLVFEGLRIVVYGSSPIRPETAARLLREHPELGFLNGYSQTEGGPMTALTPADHRRAVTDDPGLLTSVGRPVPGAEVVIHDPDPDGVGEVWARADHLAAPAADGWLHTGDLGRVDSEGYAYLVGRKGDLIIRGGENVYPDEVERRLVSHPAIKEVAVVGLPHLDLGEEVVAFVVPEDPAAPLDTDGLRAYARAELAGFKVPGQWRTLDELPRGALNKVLRRKLREG